MISEATVTESIKIWNCGMSKSIPFSPSMQFGGVSENGIIKLNKLLNQTDEKI